VIKVKCVDFRDPLALLGKHIYIYLKDGRQFGFKVMACGPEWLEGLNDEQLEMAVPIEDIDFILGG
jgi:hypothetical protein